MTELRRSAERGHADHGWLDPRHTFSFADYYDPGCTWASAPCASSTRTGWLAGQGLRHAPASRHGDHSYVLEGALGHRDSIGTGSAIEPGDVQRMSAGSGVRHSEFNHEKQGVTHFLQIWIEPMKPASRRPTSRSTSTRGKARPAAPRRLPGRTRRLRHHPPGRAAICRPFRWRRERSIRAAEREGLRSRRPRPHHRQRASPGGRGCPQDRRRQHRAKGG